jgi:leucyl aminopeptidase
VLEIEVTDAAPDAVEADLLGLGVPEPIAWPAAGKAVDERLGGRLAHLAADGEIKGGAGRVAVVYTRDELAAPRVAVAGLGRVAKLDADGIRTAAARAADRLIAVGGGTIAWAVDPELPVPAAEQARAVVDGVALTSFDHGRWKTIDPRPKEISKLVLVGDGLAPVLGTARRAAVACDWANLCRRLVDTPANELDPVRLAAEAAAVADGFEHLTCEVWGPGEIRGARMSAFLAVAQGSANEPRLITLRWSPPEARAGVVLGLVGKAITFDTGGISIKPAARMDELKDDMAGGGAVVAAMGAIAQLAIPLNVVAVVPACENMPSGTATRPGDIVTARNGKTVEIVNTDAEGRLVLADALGYCREQGATHMLDLATLTGACVVALGDFYAGLVGNDEAWVEQVRVAGAATGDHAWPLPFHETYRRHIGSTYADFRNSSDLRQAGPVYPALFLVEFTGEGPWAHLDIAGTAALDRTRGDYYTSKGATGYGVRLIAELARRLAEGD